MYFIIGRRSMLIHEAQSCKKERKEQKRNKQKQKQKQKSDIGLVESSSWSARSPAPPSYFLSIFSFSVCKSIMGRKRICEINKKSNHQRRQPPLPVASCQLWRCTKAKAAQSRAQFSAQSGQRPVWHRTQFRTSDRVNNEGEGQK